jgi:hypothetical protein
VPGLGTFPPHPYFICTIQTPIPDYAGVPNYGATHTSIEKRFGDGMA